MPGYTTVTTFFDESGKFKDHTVVCFGGVASYGEDVNRFAEGWGRLLFTVGLKSLAPRMLSISSVLSELETALLAFANGLPPFARLFNASETISWQL